MLYKLVHTKKDLLCNDEWGTRISNYTTMDPAHGDKGKTLSRKIISIQPHNQLLIQRLAHAAPVIQSKCEQLLNNTRYNTYPEQYQDPEDRRGKSTYIHHWISYITSVSLILASSPSRSQSHINLSSSSSHPISTSMLNPPSNQTARHQTK